MGRDRLTSEICGAAHHQQCVALIRAIVRNAMREWEWLDRIIGGKVRVRYIIQDQAASLIERLPVRGEELRQLMSSIASSCGSASRMQSRPVAGTTNRWRQRKEGDVDPIADLYVLCFGSKRGAARRGCGRGLASADVAEIVLDEFVGVTGQIAMVHAMPSIVVLMSAAANFKARSPFEWSQKCGAPPNKATQCREQAYFLM